MAQQQSAQWREELHGYMRAVSGAALFGTPLLYTMEMWWIGMYADLWKLLVFFALAYVANLGLTYIAGFRDEASFAESVNEAIEVMAIALVASAVVLLVLNRISVTDPLESTLGKIIIQTVPLSIGASLANAIFHKGSRQGDDNEQAVGASDQHPWRATVNDLGATAIGSTFIAFAIAPTDEIPLLAAGLDLAHLLALIVLTLLLGYAIVFASGFDPTSRQPQQEPFQHPVTETTFSYAVALAVSFLALFLFDRLHFSDPLPHTVAQVLALGLPATVGGAAGRLAV